MILDQKRQYWVNDIYKSRDKDGEYFTLCKELKRQPKKFFEYFRMLPSTFEYLLNKTHDKLEKYSTFRKCIEPRQKLTVTLRYV